MRRRSSIRTRLTWAFLLVTVAGMALVMFSFNIVFWGRVVSEIESNGRMRGPQPGQAVPGPVFQGLSAGEVPVFQGIPGQGTSGQPGVMGQGMGLRVTLWEALYEGRQLAFQVSLAAGALGLVFAAVVSYFVAERLTRPVRRLAQVAGSPRPGPGSFSVYPEDPAEMVELAGALGSMTQRLQQEDETRRNLFADIAHELRHPIALLRGRLEMLQDSVIPATPENLTALQDEVIRLGRLVADVRELSLAEVGTLSLSLRPVDLADEIAVTLENFEPVAAGKGIRLAVETEELPVVTVDPDRIRQILANLLSNGIRHTPEAGRITLRAVRQADRVVITVADTGPGIAPADLDRIFDRFYRADRSRTRSTGGTGLGLAIARSLARLHGGDLTAANGSSGAIFTLSIPVTKTDGPAS